MPVARPGLAFALAVVTAALAAVLMMLMLAPPVEAAGDPIAHVRVAPPNEIVVRLTAPPADPRPEDFRFTEASAPDAPIPVTAVRVEDGNRVRLTLDATVHPSQHYRLEMTRPAGARDVRPSALALMFTIFLSSALINNFVFTRYLGLCVFFGVSKRRETAIGMGITFTAVIIATGMFSWAVFTYVLKPLHLGFLQVVVFIGAVAAVVQFLDTMLKKTHPQLHRGFGVYLMLITTNCIILAVPLLNAAADASAIEAFSLAVGSGVGFALALLVMSCAREKLELARVPKSFEGLPMAFALAGLFALAFMGFSGLDFFR
jgi:electron transport complex protein RnfA